MIVSKLPFNFLNHKSFNVESLKIWAQNLLQTSEDEVDTQLTGTCSEEANLAGSHTKVISYCISTSHRKYWMGFNRTLNNISYFYPDFLVRVYATKKDISFLQTQITPRKFLYYCDINNLPYPLNGTVLANIPMTLWRFAAMGDPNVDVAMFRDSDSMIIDREFHAVQEWLKSNKTLHIIRDNTGQGALILAGLFGLKMNENNRQNITDIRDKMFERTRGRYRKSLDQSMLAKVLWPVLKNDVLAHDSYHCKRHRGTVPFPTKRDGRKIIAMRYENPRGE